MRLPGTIEDRLEVILADRRRLLRTTDVAALEDEGIRVDCSLDGSASCILLRLGPRDVQFLRGRACADFALLLDRGDDAFEAHVVELKKTVDPKAWIHVQEQLEWAVVRLLAVAGVLGIRLHGVTIYTAFCRDKLAQESSPNPIAMKIPVGLSGSGAADADALRWAEARRSWERGRVRMDVFGQEVEHRRIRADEGGRAAVACHLRTSPDEGDTRWFLQADSPSPPPEAAA
jgi:hypothetical protein